MTRSNDCTWRWACAARAREERSEHLLTGALLAAGLPEQLLAVARRPSIEQGLIAEHEQAVGELGAFGVSTIRFPEAKLGFFGPVVDPHWYELRRERKQRAEPLGLSDVHLAIDSALESVRAAEFSRRDV